MEEISHLEIIQKARLLVTFSTLFFMMPWGRNIHGFKNRTGERTGKGSGSRTSGPTGVGPVVEPVTS
jgi:hypothetical protein